MGNLGVGELLIILIGALVVFGPRRLPEIGKALGKGIREFQSAVRGVSGDEEEPPRAKAEPLPPIGSGAAGHGAKQPIEPR